MPYLWSTLQWQVKNLIIEKVSCLVIFAKLQNCTAIGKLHLHTTHLIGEAAQICGI